LQACARLKSGLANLSAERIRQEMLKLLEAPRAVPTLKVMAKVGILGKIIPYTDDWRVIERLPRDGVLRMFALSKNSSELKDRFRLSNEQAKRIDALASAPHVSPKLSGAERRRMVYMLGLDTWRDAVAMAHAQGRASLDDKDWLELAKVFELPVFPVSGKDLVAQGVKPGPALGRVLQTLEDWWLASDFKPGKEELLQRIENEKN
jgi:poly(A) polymerase